MMLMVVVVAAAVVIMMISDGDDRYDFSRRDTPFQASLSHGASNDQLPHLR